MAKMSSRTFFNLFKTGGTGNTPIKKSGTSRGVHTAGSDLPRADSRAVLNISKMVKKRALLLTPFMMEDLAQGAKMERYARRAVQDSINRSEAPVASHLFYYTVLSYNSRIERDVALHSQLVWVASAELIVVYVDMGITPAMQVVINVAETKNKKIEYRSIGGFA